MNIDLSTVGKFTVITSPYYLNLHDTNMQLIESIIDHGTGFLNVHIWYTYDSNGNVIHYKNSLGHGIWYTYDSDNNCIRMYDTKGSAKWYNAMGEEISEDEYYSNKVWDIRHTA